MNTVQPIRDKKDIDNIKRYLRQSNLRDYLMFMVGISSNLRISDILMFKVSTVWDGKKVREHIRIREQKTGKPKAFKVSENLERAIREYLTSYQYSMDDYLFISRKGENTPITRQQAALILSNAADEVGIKYAVSTHSMRKTWGYWAYKSGVSLALIMEALNHSSIANTKKYLGITQDDLDEVYVNLNL